MSSNDNVDIGFDPLAWMNDDSNAEAPEQEPKAATKESPVAAAAEESSPVEKQPEESVVVQQPEPVISAAGDSLRIDLAGKVDIASAGELKQELSEALNGEGSITFAAADVARADGAGLQLLTAFIKELDGSKRTLIWEEPSAQLIDAAHIVGLKEALHLP